MTRNEDVKDSNNQNYHLIPFEAKSAIVPEVHFFIQFNGFDNFDSLLFSAFCVSIVRETNEEICTWEENTTISNLLVNHFKKVYQVAKIDLFDYIFDEYFYDNIIRDITYCISDCGYIDDIVDDERFHDAFKASLNLSEEDKYLITEDLHSVFDVYWGVEKHKNKEPFIQ